MRSLLSWFAGENTGRSLSGTRGPSRLVADAEPETIYAIGDVHGCVSLLTELEGMIFSDAGAFGGQKWIVMLGDLIDRGSHSAQVLDHCLRPIGADFRRLCLKGNHEAMMLAFLARPDIRSDWLAFGGWETLMSYGIPADGFEEGMSARTLAALVGAYVWDEHVSFLEALPIVLDTPSAVFSHAGVLPGVPIDAQTEADLLWTRDGFADDYSSVGKRVVHGHIPREEALISTHRIALDTGAYQTGRLTAVRLRQGEPPRLLTAAGQHSAANTNA